MSAHLDEISPRYVGARRIAVTLDRDAQPAAFAPTIVHVDYSGAAPEGVMLPLLLTIQGPSQESYQTRVFTRHAPTQVVVKPREGGPHLVSIREVAHNQWWGAVRFHVAGERLAKERPI